VILGSEAALCDLLSASESQTINQLIPSGGSLSLKNLTRQASRELERKIILKVLQENHWNRRQTARLLNISYRALLYKMKEASMTAPRASDEGSTR
jgi:two-component system response regulator AtoC